MPTTPDDDLTRADLTSADLPTQADLTRANLPTHADLTRADVDGADVTRAGYDAVPVDAEEPPRPRSQGRYRLGATLGEGGMAIVIEAEDLPLKRPVAIKQLREALRENGGARRAFFAEAEILAGLDHPGVVSVHEAGLLEDGAPFYAMAKVKGPTLADLLEGDGASAYRVSMRHVEIVQRAAETVGHAHARGLIHLDLKPGNVMVEDDGAVFVMDWGIARRVGVAATSERGLLKGTPGYMSPEVAEGRADTADARSDVFGLGVILYQVLTGTRPFPGETPVELVRAVSSVDPVDPRRTGRHVPRELAAVCMKALSRDPAARYATAREFANDLRDYRSFLPVSALRPTLRDRAVNWVRRHPRAATAIVTAVVVLAVAVGVRGYRLAAQRAMVEGLRTEYTAILADVDRLEAALAAFERSGPGAAPAAGTRAEVERQQIVARLDLRRDDARSLAVAMLALTLTRNQPDPVVVRALSDRLHEDVDRARAAGDYVRMKVLAETRLELVRDMSGQFAWPVEEQAYLRAVLAEAEAAIARRLNGR